MTMLQLSYRARMRNVNNLWVFAAAFCVMIVSAGAEQGESADPLNTRITQSDSVAGLAKTLDDDGALPNAVSANTLDQASVIYRRYVALLAEKFATPPEDENELFVRLDALAAIYQHFANHENVAGWVFADTAKMFALAEEQHWIACRLDDPDVIKRLREVNRRFRIDPLLFAALTKDADQANGQDDEDSRESVGGWSRKKYIHEIGEAADRIWRSHGYSSFNDAFPGLSSLLLLVYPDILARGDAAKLAYGVLFTDAQLTTVAEGTGI